MSDTELLKQLTAMVQALDAEVADEGDCSAQTAAIARCLRTATSFVRERSMIRAKRAAAAADTRP